MYNVKSAIIRVIDIEAAYLLNPNWSNEVKELEDRYYSEITENMDKTQNQIRDHELSSEEDCVEFLDEINVEGEDLSGTSDSDDSINLAPTAYEITEERRNRLYIGSLPVSLDLLKLQKEYKEEFYTSKNKKTGKPKTYRGDFLREPGDEKIFTDAIVNVTFNKTEYEIAEELSFVNRVRKNGKVEIKKVYKGKKGDNTLKLRKRLYENGFRLKFGDNIVEYVRYKRTASKARQGSHLFIKRELKDALCSDWKQFNVTFEEGKDDFSLAEIKAYESLTLSGIVDTVHIQRDEILLIDDVIMPVKIRGNVTLKDENGNLIAEDFDEHEKFKNSIWDGQSLADTTLFKCDEAGKQKGMMLLRNNFFKSCAFNTNIQKWFNDQFGDDKPEYIRDMFRRKVKIEKIKLITTPCSLKFLKFEKNFDSKKKCYEQWLKSMSSMFGICKSEHISRFGNSQQLSYQIVNSLPLSKGEVETLSKEGIEHIDLLKNNATYFKDYIKNEIKDPLPSDNFILELLESNDKAWNLEMVRNYATEKTNKYIQPLREGRIKVKNSDYAVLFGNPIEMLQYATYGKEEMKNRTLIRPLMKEQIYCSDHKDDEILAGFRNPHITMGNVLIAQNVYKKEFEDYFNLTDNIVISNAYDTDIMHRLQGQDYDSDEVLLSSDPILVKAAQVCQNENFRVPVNGIDGNTIREYTIEEEINLDHRTATAQKRIGEVVNLSQILNSYYWDNYNATDGSRDDEYLKKIYNQICILSSLSQVEIDRAKKDYDIKTGKHLGQLRADKYLIKKDKKDIKKDEVSDDEEKQLWMFDDDIEYYNERKRYYKSCGGISKVINNIEQEMNNLRSSKPDRKYYEKYFELEQELREAQFFKAYVDDGEDLVALTKRAKMAVIISGEKDVQIRPMFFKYCSDGDGYIFQPFNTPMDYLQQLINNVIRKDSDHFVDISKIFQPPDSDNVNYKQLPKIHEICVRVSDYIAWLNKRNVDGEMKYQLIQDKYKEEIEKLKAMTIYEDTIRAAIYRACSNINSDYYNEDFGKIKRILLSCLYEAKKDIFNQILKDTINHCEKKQ